MSFMAWRHAADMGLVNLFYVQDPGAYAPAVNPTWDECDQAVWSVSPDRRIYLFATRPDQGKIIAQTPVVTTVVSHRCEFYLVGTTAKNARFVVLDREVSLPG
jgi:hypothetical protein